MNQELVRSNLQEALPENGMLFVRTEGILHTMVRAPIILAGLIVMILMNPVQNSFSSTKTLDMIIYPDGSTHVSSEIEVDPLEPDFILDLFGKTIDNFVVIGESEFLLDFDVMDNTAIIETFGSSSISLEYDIHDLVSKESRIWTFTIESPTQYSLTMPYNTVIVGMSSLPVSMDFVNEQTRLILPSGPSEINYVFGTQDIPLSPSTNFEIDNSILLIAGAIVAAGVIVATIVKKSHKTLPKNETISQQPEEHLDTETIFNAKPDLREDDKELIKFLSENDGKALESELRKKFLLPRTTMWRAVKRLERQGIIEIEKKELQNLVKLKKKLEDEE